MKIEIVNGIDTWKLDTNILPPEIKDEVEMHAGKIIKAARDIIYHSEQEIKTEIKLKEK